MKKLFKLSRNPIFNSFAMVVVAYAATSRSFCMFFFHEPPKPQGLAQLTAKDLL